MKTISAWLGILVLLGTFPAFSAGEDVGTGLPIYNPGRLKPGDSKLKVKVGESAPNFKLRSIKGDEVSLAEYRGKKNVVLSFVPAAFTPVCSAQWPGYNLVQNLFQEHNAVLIGMTTDNIPSLYAWNQVMGGMWFDIVSDFWPHGKISSSYGVLRSDGTTERALFVIDKAGIIRYIDVHDINERPALEDLVAALNKLPK